MANGQHDGDISYGTVLTIMDESGVVDSDDQANKLWHWQCIKLEFAEHNASATGATEQQQHEQVLVAIATTETKAKKASEAPEGE